MALPPEDQPDVDDVLKSPNVARIYDYYLGGKTNFKPDRMVAEATMSAVPGIRPAALANRRFLVSAVQYMARQGIRQFLDIGCGLPTMNNTHQAAQEVAPDTRVMYVDKDPIVIQHARALLAGGAGVHIMEGDLTDPASIMSDPQVHQVLDFGAPVGVLLVAVLHFLVPADDPYGIVAAIRDKTAPGSYLAVSHSSKQASGMDKAVREYRSASPAFPRDRDEVARFFDGYDLVPPGVVALKAWQPDVLGVEDDLGAVGIGGIGRKR